MLRHSMYVPFGYNGGFTDVRPLSPNENCAGNNLDAPFPLQPKGHDILDFQNLFNLPLCIRPSQKSLSPKGDGVSRLCYCGLSFVWGTLIEMYWIIMSCLMKDQSSHQC